jgi:hypothetical protein
MAHRDVLAPRQDGTVARLRVYDEFTPPLAVDSDRAYAAVNVLGKYNPSYRSSTKFFTSLASLVLVGGIVALIWWPWWVPIVGFFLSYIMFKAAKQSCADFVRDIVRDNPTGREEMTRLGLIVPKLPANVVSE